MSSPQENLYDAIRIVKRKIIPLAFILYFFNYMDRVNIGFAALRMNESLGITPEDFANISSIFFISYLIFQIPSSIGLQKLGARKWISSIIIGWGAVTGLIFFAKDTQHILLARIFLGYLKLAFSRAWFIILHAGSRLVNAEKSIVSSCYLLLLHRYWLHRCLVGSSSI
ncbi:hypothetical protein LTSEUGA_3319 [Salmonella enterica subsp. enterica serovar Uganda str. R8-3404]|uniref:Permease n=1 Tax=Salmonella enterica subsp. enterica serovar Uganda str. R8-3404 TaxID=913083 RepID=A0A6C8GZV3_SALET|nr:hypothetical protein LTSEUGA_3319 [Salmonella enterica subsp. enterica serovar Uganda str. R8-3404]